MHLTLIIFSALWPFKVYNQRIAVILQEQLILLNWSEILINFLQVYTNIVKKINPPTEYQMAHSTEYKQKLNGHPQGMHQVSYA